MAEEPPKGLRLIFGKLQIGALVTLLLTVLGGFYTAVQWVTTVQHVTQRNARTIEEIGRKLDALSVELNRKIDGLNAAGAALHDRDNQIDSKTHEQILDIQKQLTDMARDYRNVGILQDRYDRAFATYQPQPRRGKR